MLNFMMIEIYEEKTCKNIRTWSFHESDEKTVYACFLFCVCKRFLHLNIQSFIHLVPGQVSGICASLYCHEGQIMHFVEYLIIYLVSIIKDVKYLHLIGN